jgi:prepilin-type N-terminal cleavage/methylation domain-containing protein
MMRMSTREKKAQSGFTLLELLIVMVLLAIVVGAIFRQVSTANERGANERVQLDLFQESREFMDQMARDLRQSGYPNPRNYDATILKCTAVNGDCTTTPPTLGDDQTTSAYAAVGLTQADANDLYFEGGVDDTNDTGKVLFTQYSYDPSTTGNCPCLRRSQQVKVQGTPTSLLGGATTANYTTEVQNVQNYLNGNNVPIFSFYTNGGTTPVPESTYSWNGVDGSGNSNNPTLASIDTVRIQLMVQSPTADLKSGQAPVITLVSTVRINNCSQAAGSEHLSCAN